MPAVGLSDGFMAENCQWGHLQESSKSTYNQEIKSWSAFMIKLDLQEATRKMH